MMEERYKQSCIFMQKNGRERCFKVAVEGWWCGGDLAGGRVVFWPAVWAENKREKRARMLGDFSYPKSLKESTTPLFIVKYKSIS